MISLVTIGVSPQPSELDLCLVWVVGGHCSTDRHSFQFHLRSQLIASATCESNPETSNWEGYFFQKQHVYARVVSGKSGARRWMNVRQDFMRHSIHMLIEPGIPNNSYCWLVSFWMSISTSSWHIKKRKKEKHSETHKKEHFLVTSLIPTPMHLMLLGMARRGQRLLRPSQETATKDDPKFI